MMPLRHYDSDRRTQETKKGVGDMNKRTKLPRRKLKEIREKLGLSQAQLATRVGIDRSTYACIETGVRDPSLETAYRIRKALKLNSIDELFIDELEVS